MAQVMMPQKTDGFDKLVKGLQVAQSVFGVYSDVKNLKKRNEADAAAEVQKNDAANAVITEPQKAELLLKGLELTPNQGEAQVAFNQKDASGTLKPVYFKLPSQKEKSVPKVYEYQDSRGNTRAGKVVDGEVFISPADKIVAYPKPKENGADGGTGKAPTAQLAAEVGDAEAAMSTMNNLANSWSQKASGVGAGLASMLPWTESRQYRDELKQSAQTIGRYLEGGKMTDADVVRYESMLPGPYDTAERAANKINSLKTMVAAKRKAQISGLSQSGFNVSGFGDLPVSKFNVPKDNSQTGTANAAPKDMPKQIRQNGVIYNLNPKTRSYE